MISRVSQLYNIYILRNAFPLAKKIGITHIFSPHISSIDTNLELEYNIKIIPYTLFPVQYNISPILSSKRKTYLVSFIGQHDLTYYISGIREKIFNIFTSYNDSYIRRRSEWHHYKDTYHKTTNMNLTANENEYRSILSNSKFSLCPSGSGSNSIRIWESMSYGSIPVILADTIRFPVLQNVNYNDIFIIWKESEIDKLHSHLLSYSEEQIESMATKNIEVFNKYFSKDTMINTILEYYNTPPVKIPVVSYCCDTFPSVGGVPRYDSHIHKIFPDRKFFKGPSEKEQMLSYVNSIRDQDPIIITDNHLACDIPNDFKVLLVHHGSAKTHAEREPLWNEYWKNLCCNGQRNMLYIRNPVNTRIISCSQFCTDEFSKHYSEIYNTFNNEKILHSSDFDETKYKTHFNSIPIILGNWSDANKGAHMITSLQTMLQNFVFRKLSIHVQNNESLNSFNTRKQQMYLEADIYLSMSLSEGNSYAALDALLCGLVVVSTDVGLFYKDLPEDCFVKLDWQKIQDTNYCSEKIKYGWENREILSNNARNWYMNNIRFIDWGIKMNNIVANFYKEKTIQKNITVQQSFWNKFLNTFDKHIQNVCILNPTDADSEVFKTVFKNKTQHTHTINTWNLNNTINTIYDLIIINHTMMYSNNPEKWFKNIFNSCKFVIITDIINRKRGGTFGDMSHQCNDTTDTTDCMRYNFSHLGKFSKSNVSFDVSKYKNRIYDITFYNTPLTKEDPYNLPESFICAFQGDHLFATRIM